MLYMNTVTIHSNVGGNNNNNNNKQCREPGILEEEEVQWAEFGTCGVVQISTSQRCRTPNS